VELHGALSDVELIGDFFVGKILEKRIENFLLASAEIRDGVCLEAASLVREDGIHETGKHGARNPEAAIRDKRESAHELLAGFGVRQEAFHTEAEKLKTVGVIVLFADDDEARLRKSFHDIGE